MAAIALNRDRGGDFKIAVAMPGIFKDRGAAISAVRHLSDQAAHMMLGHVEKFRDALLHHRLAVFVHQPLEIACAHLTGPD